MLWVLPAQPGTPPSPHHVDGLGVAGEAEGVAAGRGAEVDGHHHGEGGGLLGASLAPLKRKGTGSVPGGAGGTGLAALGKRAKHPPPPPPPHSEGVNFPWIGPGGTAWAGDAAVPGALCSDAQRGAIPPPAPLRIMEQGGGPRRALGGALWQLLGTRGLGWPWRGTGACSRAARCGGRGPHSFQVGVVLSPPHLNPGKF